MQQEIHEIEKAKELLVEMLGTYNINEFQAPQFITWYETVRDRRFQVGRDNEAYKVAKAVVGLSNTIKSLAAMQ